MTKMIKIPLYPHTCYASARIPTSRCSKWIAALGVFVLAGFVFLFLPKVSAKGASPEKFVRGTVHDDEGALSGALVRIQTTEQSTVTGSNGKFELAVPESFSDPVKLTVRIDSISCLPVMNSPKQPPHKFPIRTAYVNFGHPSLSICRNPCYFTMDLRLKIEILHTPIMQ